MKFIIFIVFFCFSSMTYAITFQEALNRIEKHESVEAIIHNSEAKEEESYVQGSWGDPMLKVAAMNFPKDSLKDDETPMTGIQLGISQKISLTTKYGNLKDAYQSLSKAYLYEANDKKQALAKILWETLILEKKVKEELLILKENDVWIDKILKVSKRLYATGKTSQQAILDIQIRKSEIESEISNKEYELLQIKDRLKYLVNDSNIDGDSIPWTALELNAKSVKDNKELIYKERLKAAKSQLTAAKLNYVPDLTVSLTYTKRSDIDDNGDFVGATVSFPLPISSAKYSGHHKAIKEKYSAEKNFINYEKEKMRDVSILNKDIEKLTYEINILSNKTIKFAENSRKITSKSYGLGSSSYVELLQSELKFQKILMLKVMLEAKRDIKRASLKYIKGESLYE